MTLTQYDIVKSLFFAERAHLNKFGRPITYDNYVAMYHGPVPSLSYDLLKENRNAMTAMGVGDLPWKRVSAESVGRGCFAFSDAVTESEDKTLSQSDIKALRGALCALSSLSFGQIRKLTHSDAAYIEAWNAVGDARSNAMSLGLLFDTPNYEAAKLVEFSSKQAAGRGSSEDEFAIPADSDFE